MERKQLRFIIDREGEITYEMVGFTGGECFEFTASLDRDGVEISRTATQEFYQIRGELENEQEQGGIL